MSVRRHAFVYGPLFKNHYTYIYEIWHIFGPYGLVVPFGGHFAMAINSVAKRLQQYFGCATKRGILHPNGSRGFAATQPIFSYFFNQA